MRVVIFEDEGPAARKLLKLINEYDASIEILAVLESVQEGLEWFQTNALPDLIFSDIQLADNLSFKVFQQLDLKVPIIFTTAFNEYAIEAFKHYSIDYLLKPVKAEDLANSIEKYISYKGLNTPQPDFEAIVSRLKGAQYRSRFLVNYRDGLIPIEAADIAYFYSEDSVTFLVQSNKKSYIINETLETLEGQLNPHNFFRANRKFIVSTQSIVKVEPYFNQKLIVHINPNSDEAVTISKLKATSFKEWLNK